MEVRLATAEDANAVFGMLTRFVTSYTADRDAFDRSYAALIAGDRAFLRVAEEDGDIIGYVMAIAFDTLFANGCVVQIEELFVEEAHRGNGVGESLVDAATGWARSLNASELTVPTRRAGTYYQRLGFTETAAYYRIPLE